MGVRRALLSYLDEGAKLPRDAPVRRPPAGGLWRQRRAVRSWAHRSARRFRNSAARPYLLAAAVWLVILLTLAAALSIFRQEFQDRQPRGSGSPGAGASR